MKAKDLKEKQWYSIVCPGAGLIGYTGKAMLISAYAKNFEKGVSKFLCEDGEIGYFTTKQVTGCTCAPKNLTDIVFKFARNSV